MRMVENHEQGNRRGTCGWITSFLRNIQQRPVLCWSQNEERRRPRIQLLLARAGFPHGVCSPKRERLNYNPRDRWNHRSQIPASKLQDHGARPYFSIYTDGRYRPLIRLFEDGLRKRSLTIRQACEIRRATRLRSDQQWSDRQKAFVAVASESPSTSWDGQPFCDESNRKRRSNNCGYRYTRKNASSRRAGLRCRETCT